MNEEARVPAEKSTSPNQTTLSALQTSLTSEAALQAKLNNMIALSEDAIISIDEHQHITLFNLSAERIFGYTADEALGKPLDLLLPSRYMHSHNRFVEQFMVSPDALRPMNERGDIFGLRKNGAEFPAEASISKFVWNGTPTLTVRLRDISERRETQRRLHIQYAVARVLAEAGDLHATIQQTLQAIGESLGAGIAALWQVDAYQNILRYSGNWHVSSTQASLFEATSKDLTFARGADLPGRVWASGQSIWMTDIANDHTFQRKELPANVGLRTALGVPIRGGNTVVAVMEFFWLEQKQPDLSLSALVDALGSQIGNFIERKRAENALRESEERQRTLADVGNILAASLDYEAMLHNLAHLIVPRLADWCTIHIVQEDRTVNLIAIAHVDPNKISFVRDLQNRYPTDWNAAEGLPNVLRTGISELYPVITSDMLATMARDTEHLDVLRRLQLRSAMIVPLIAHGRTLGAITMFWAESERHYSREDMSFVEELGRRTAMAVDNARLYRLAQQSNMVLEQRVMERTAQQLAANAVLESEIAERRRAEEQVRTLNLELEQRVNERTTQLKATLTRSKELYEISHRIGLARTADDILAVLLSTSFLHTSLHASIAIFDHPWVEDGKPPNELAIYANWNADPSTPDIFGQRYPLETEWMRIVQLRIGPVVIDDVETDRHLSQQSRQHLRKISSRSVIIFPLIAGGKWYGMISFHFAQRHPIDHEDIPHMRGLVDQAAAAINNQRLLEAEAKARQEAERANELRLRFLAMISHELRTPLTSIKGFTTTLLADDVEWDAQTQREFIGIMNQEADKLTDMIDQLLDLSRLEAGSLAINPEKQQLCNIISGALPQLKAIALNHRLVIDVSDQLQPVRADRQRLTQVLTNLVSNAAKYSPAETNITLTATHVHDYVRVDVSDNGAGIPAQDRLYVFEAFRRGNDERVRRTKGAGLGLAICKGLIEAHGGRIWIQDQDGPGTTISFTLPVAE